MMPDIRHGERKVFSKCPSPIDADPFGIFAEMASSGETVSTTTTNHMSFTTDHFTRMEVGDIGTNLDDFADKFMTDHHRDGNRFLSPRIPLVNVDIGSTDPRSIDTNQDIIDPNSGDGNPFQGEAGAGMLFHQGLHRIHDI